MGRNDYLAEIARFKATLTALDCTHRLNGHQYTPAEILNVRRAIGTLEQLVDVGLYDFKKAEATI